jgi:hypothetical protein
MKEIHLHGDFVSKHPVARVLGFVAFSRDTLGLFQRRATLAFEELASVFDLRVNWFELQNFKIGIISRVPISLERNKNFDRMSFVVSSAISERIESDRFLKVSFTGEGAWEISQAR